MVERILRRSLYGLVPFVGAILIRSCNEQGGWHVYRLVSYLVAGVAGRFFGFPCLQRADSYFVAVRGAIADRSLFPARHHGVND